MLKKNAGGTPDPAKPSTTTNESLVVASDVLPSPIPLVPVSQTTLFPGMMVPFILPEGKLVRTVEHALTNQQGYLGVVLGNNPSEKEIASGPNTSFTGLPAEGTVAAALFANAGNDLPPSAPAALADAKKEFQRYGVACKVLKKFNLPDNQVSVLVQGVQRFQVKEVISRDPLFVAQVEYLHEVVEKGTEVEALLRSCLSQFKQLSKDNPLISEEVKVALVNIDGPGRLADFMASVLIRDVKDYQTFLAETSVRARLHHLLLLLKKELEVQTVQKKIQEDINQKISSSQRDFYLQEQLKFIQKELGRDTNERHRLVDKFKQRLVGKTLRPAVKERIEDELEKIQNLNEQSSEYSVSLNYLDWVTAVPWGVVTKDSQDLKRARRILDEDHYGLKDVKERILEYLAVRKLSAGADAGAEGSILCFVGPPGTGKTSLGKSIARTLGRKFFRFSVGGMRDEAEIKGHRKTYVGAMPGKLVQGFKKAGSENPVFLIDEIDKMGSGWHSGGDPASALLELLDPEQNSDFLDHYLDLNVDCSKVFFVTTANTTESIPGPLLDRMEIITLSGYTDKEKIEIARSFLIPRQLRKHGLVPSQLKITDAGLKTLIERYARESGVRNLEKQIARLCRKTAYRVATGSQRAVQLKGEADAVQWLGPALYSAERSPELLPGVITGLAYTSYGGEVLHVESLYTSGKGGLHVTGTLGKVMTESANIAFSFVRERCRERLKIPGGFFEKNTFHLHVPAGATPKDGPSAGITMASSLYSLISGVKVDPKTAMTGELTLSGRVLPVGGIKEKLLAAKRSGLRRVLIPLENMKDLKRIEKEIKDGIEIIGVDHMDHVLSLLFKPRPLKTKAKVTWAKAPTARAKAAAKATWLNQKKAGRRERHAER